MRVKTVLTSDKSFYFEKANNIINNVKCQLVKLYPARKHDVLLMVGVNCSTFKRDEEKYKTFHVLT